MLFISLAILIIYKLFLAGKDSSSYLLRDKANVTDITLNRIKRWHRDGVILDLLFTGALVPTFGWWVILQSLLVRLSVFDVAFNHWSGLNINYLGSTAATDKFFVKIFGINGAVKKSLIFLILSLIFTAYVTWF